MRCRAKLELRPQRPVAFAALARAFTGRRLSHESGCRRFQVVRLKVVLAIEAYDDKATFDRMVKANRAPEPGRHEPEGP